MQTRIRIAQIRTIPEAGNLRGNHNKLMSVLDDISAEAVDVVITPECFLDGYIATDEGVLHVNDENGRVISNNVLTNPNFDAGLICWNVVELSTPRETRHRPPACSRRPGRSHVKPPWMRWPSTPPT